MTQVKESEPRSDLRLYNIVEAADLLRISERTLYKLVEERQVPFRRIGKVGVRFSAQDIRDILANSYRPAVAR